MFFFGGAGWDCWVMHYYLWVCYATHGRDVGLSFFYISVGVIH